LIRGIHVTDFGGPEVLTWDELAQPQPGPGDLLIEVAAAGVNFIDVYHRTGLYPVPLPFTPGVEGAGIVAEIGSDVAGIAVGDRVAWTGPRGSYATRAVIPADVAVAVPDEISLTTAAAVLLQGITAHYLATSTRPLEAGDRCLVHAGAGGVGGLLIQIAKMRGAEVFATAGGADKVAIASAAGADHVIDYQAEDFVAAIESITGSRPLDVIFDGVGAATFQRGFALLRPRGMAVAFGNASGAIPPIDPLDLLRNGSIYITRPTAVDYLASRAERLARTGDLFGWLESGSLEVRVGDTYPLSEAAAAHRALEGRLTTGKVLLES
jgi:NADPH2:quinone reductase